MRIETAGNEIKITPEDDFSAKKIFDCGQCFRWNENPDGSYTGVALGRAARVREDGGSVYITGTIEDFETVWSDYFDFGSNYAERRKLCAVDDYMLAASEYGKGIRILNQDRWEALCSFIISQCNNIPRIKKIVETMASLWGEETELGGDAYRAFPNAERVAALSERDLEPLRSGYRAPYILNAARMVSEGRLDLEALSKLEYAEAKRRLMEL
ncbi:MAG: 8-oxoguanine DNA glycosylase, partial [Oscillospiraceae bacterium]|nr:8-oxoguanine DNA glycosylase [Oscillospiraceae bacterium]